MDYWQKRQAKIQENLTNKSIEETEAQLKKHYASATKKIIGQFEETYNKILLSIDEGREPTPADLYKLDKYWKMQAQLKQELQKLGDKSIELMSRKFEEQYGTIYNSIALKDETNSFTQVNAENAKQVINQIWCADGKSWSERVWINTDKLQQALNDNLIDAVVSGKKSGDLKKLLMAQFQVSYNRADTLVRTELARIQTEASRDRYKNYGIEEVEVLVEPDACPICQGFRNKKYPIFGKMPVPAHPNCRCCIVPVVE